MIQNRICRECGRVFKGGPRAYYCPGCREERRRALDREWKALQRQGISPAVRPLGSTDYCEKCGKPYTVVGGLQRFCPDCQPIHAKEYDRETGLKYYHKNARSINPIRNQKRRIGPVTCPICGRQFETHTCQKYCSAECRKAALKEWRRRANEKRKHKK